MSVSQLDYILSPKSVRERAGKIFAAAENGATHFKLHLDQLPAVADFTLEVTRESYPDGAIPFHSRWEHFRVGGVDRVRELDRDLAELTPRDRARSKIDLAIISVLLDAGAGNEWKFTENGAGTYTRSEGLAVASLHLFRDGALSSDPRNRLRADADGLSRVDEAMIARCFQVSPHNPLVGVEGRVGLLKRLGEACRRHGDLFRGEDGSYRPGNLIDAWFRQTRGGVLPASEILRSLLIGLAEMWPPRTKFGGMSFGDVWSHPILGATGTFEGLMPFHKLSQWLSYSLIEPAEEAGLKVEGVHELTGLPEYRNGGLLLDMGVLELRDPAMLTRAHKPESELIIEWRALTIVCLDRIGALVRQKLGKTEQELPLAKVLQGGTWTAGRKVAKRLRSDGSPPLKLESDGTVF
jgi:hypothetical protein